MSARVGFGLIELIVALTLFSVGLLGLAATTAVAQRSLTSAALIERGVDLAAGALDSLAHVATPAAGSIAEAGVAIAWTIDDDSTTHRIRLAVTFPSAHHVRPLDYTMVHSARAP